MSDESFRLTPQSKPIKSLNYKEKIRIGVISVGLKRSKLNHSSEKNQKRTCIYRKMCDNDDVVQRCFICGFISDKFYLERHHKYGRSKENLFKYLYVCPNGLTCKNYEVVLEDGRVVKEGGHEFIHHYPNKARELELLCF